MNYDKIRKLYNWFFMVSNQIGCVIIGGNDRVNIKNALIEVSHEIESVYPSISSELFRLKDYLFNNVGQINGVIFGEILALLRFLCNEQGNTDINIWNMIHPRIANVSREIFEDGHYSEACENAFIEINARVKHIFKLIRPDSKVPDGVPAMNIVFSLNDPIVKLTDISTETGENIQKGYMQMFVGAMSALRNPKAHENFKINKDEGMRRLVFASMLMYELDAGVRYTGINE